MAEAVGYKPHLEGYEVVCIKDDKSELDAMPEDFKRVFIEAESPHHARMNAEPGDGYRALFTANPGILTEPEVLARRRSMEGAPVDKSKI